MFLRITLMDQICDLIDDGFEWIPTEGDESVKNIPYSMIPWKQLFNNGPGENTSSGRLLAVLYTSGSTGRPKGARILHSSAINRLEWQWKEFPYRDEDMCVFKVTLLVFFVTDYIVYNKKCKTPF